MMWLCTVRFHSQTVVIISAKWTEWTGEISCDAFFRPWALSI